MELSHYEGGRTLKGISNDFTVVENDNLFYITETINIGIDEVYKQSYKIDKELVRALYKIKQTRGANMEQLSISINKDLLDRVREQADKQSRSMASVIREALIIYLESK